MGRSTRDGQKGVTATRRSLPFARADYPELNAVLSWAKRDVKSRYRDSGLHLLWTIIQPVSVIAVYAIVFREILRVDGDGSPYLSFVVVGMIIWRYFSVGLGQSMSLVDHADIMGKIKFRREIIPLSACLGGLIDLGIGTVALIVIAGLQGINPSSKLLGLIPIYLVLTMYTGTAAILVSTVTVFVRDTAMALPTLQQVLFFATPVMYAQSRVPQSLRFLETINPMWFIIESARNATLRQSWPNLGLLVIHLVVSLMVFRASVSYLRSIEHRIVDIV